MASTPSPAGPASACDDRPCKGTLEALSAADMILIFHVLFSKWLREVQGRAFACRW
jgi:hypothetical protein